MKLVVEIPDEWVESQSTDQIERRILRLLAVERLKSLAPMLSESEEEFLLAELDAAKTHVRETLRLQNPQA